MTPPKGSAVAVLRAMVEMFSTGDVSSVGDVIAAGYLDHQGLGGNELRGADGFIQVVTAARRAYSELNVEVVDIKLSGDNVEGHVHWQGVRHDGTAVRRETIETVRVVDGRAVEHWGKRL
jgi:predicted SnoaL-like aldol condensation-catalyzing enzyme